MENPFEGSFTYPRGFADLVKQTPAFRTQYRGMNETLHDIAQFGLDPLRDQKVIAPTEAELEALENPDKIAAEKYTTLCKEFEGQSEFLALHALTIAAARRSEPPAIARAIFLAMWQDHGDFLMDRLDTRWQLSALQTFRDYGENEVQRRCASELTVFFGLIKLYETERRYSGFKAKQPFDLDTRTRSNLPLGMDPYSIKNGDLDRNLLGMIWATAETDPVLRPLACHLLTSINRERGSIFRRFRLMRRELKKRRAQK